MRKSSMRGIAKAFISYKCTYAHVHRNMEGTQKDEGGMNFKKTPDEHCEERRERERERERERGRNF